MNFIIKPPKNNKKAIRVLLPQQVITDMKKYCESAGIKKKDYFIEECIKYVLQTDSYWREIVKSNESTED